MGPYRVTIIGAGLTGALTACRLKRAFKDRILITLLEKSRGAGGRMSTNRCEGNPMLTTDLGAQYISTSEHCYEKYKSFYEELLAAGALKEFGGKIVGPNRFEEHAKHFVSPSGINTVVKHFLNEAGSNVIYNNTVEKIELINEASWLTFSKDQPEGFKSDAVISTIPVPQLLNIQGLLQNFLKPHLSKLEQVEYSSRYAMALYFHQNLSNDIPWSCKYLSHDDCLRFISIDTTKREIDSEHGSSIVLHTTVPFGLKYLQEDISTVQPIILASLKKQLPALPTPISTKCHRWRYSQVYKAYPNTPGCVVLSDVPVLIAGGDSFSQSTFDGCILSSTSIIDKLAERMKLKEL
eukprot:gene12281-13546_t